MKKITKRLPARSPTIRGTTLGALTGTTVYSEAGQEPSIAEMLAEPIVRRLMERDAVSVEALVAVIDDARAQRMPA